MWTRFIDAHLHLQDPRFDGKLERVIAKAAVYGICRLFCNATTEADWPVVAAVAARHTWVIPFLGIHPWYIGTAEPGWEQRLEEALSACAHGAGVGETGLDRTRPVEFSAQVKMFEAHLDIAAHLGLPLTVHCVRSWQTLLDLLETRAKRGTLPLTLIHSFNGSAETMRRLVDLGCFISYSAGITDPGKTALREVFRLTPLESLFLETDAPDQLVALLADQEDLITTHNEPAIIAAVYRAAAHLRDIHLEDFAARIWHNATIYAHKALVR